MKLTFLTPHDRRWSEFLSAVPHQFYHLPGYCSLLASHEGGSSEAVLITQGADYFFVPYTLRTLADVDCGEDGQEFRDLRSPDGYAAPLIHADRAAFLPQALRCWIDAMRDRRVVSGFIRLDPLLEIPHALADFGRIWLHGHTVSVDLSADEATIWKHIRASTRQRIKRACDAGFALTVHHGGGALDDFCSIYRETMDRVEADQRYYFCDEHFRRLTSLLGDSLYICTAHAPDSRPLSAGMLVEYRGLVQHHLHGTRNSALPQFASPFLLHAMLLAAKARGNRLFHLGGGRGAAADALFEFKSGFSKSRHPYATWRVAFLPAVYNRFARRRSELARADAPQFFPAYRLPGDRL